MSLSSSDRIQLSAGLGFPDFKTGKPERNLEIFQSLLRNFFVVSIFCSEHLKSYPKLISLALQNLKVSAPNFCITGKGSTTFPLLLLIFVPCSSTPYPIIHASDQGALPVSCSHLSMV